MKTRAILLVAAAVMLAVPSAYAAPGGNHKNDYSSHETRKNQKVHKARVERSQNQRENVRQIQMDVRQNRNEVRADRRLEQKITRQNIQNFRANANAERRYHYATQWRAPNNWHYQRWSYGQRLPMISYSRDYWISDYSDFGLYGPPDGYEWIRYGNDALLVDLSTGEIIRVEYNNFY